jgi:hypothetical protein
VIRHRRRLFFPSVFPRVLVEHAQHGERLSLALNDREEFCRRYAAVRPPAYDAYQCASPALAKNIREGQDDEKRREARDVCDAVVARFLVEEPAHQVIDASEAAGTLLPPWPAPRPVIPAPVPPGERRGANCIRRNVVEHRPRPADVGGARAAEGGVGVGRGRPDMGEGIGRDLLFGRKSGAA